MDFSSIYVFEPCISVHLFDISGTNILLDKPRTNIKLADFGISTIMEVSSRFYLQVLLWLKNVRFLRQRVSGF